MTNFEKRIAALETKAHVTEPHKIELVVGPSITMSEWQAEQRSGVAQHQSAYRSGDIVTQIILRGVIPDANILALPLHDDR